MAWSFPEILDHAWLRIRKREVNHFRDQVEEEESNEKRSIVRTETALREREEKQLLDADADIVKQMEEHCMQCLIEQEAATSHAHDEGEQCSVWARSVAGKQWIHERTLDDVVGKEESDTITRLLKDLVHNDLDRRIYSARCLAFIVRDGSSSTVTETFYSQLEDENEAIRSICVAAIDSAIAHGHTTAIDGLLKCAYEGGSEGRLLSLNWLFLLTDDKRCLDAVVFLAELKDASVRQAALKVILKAVGRGFTPSPRFMERLGGGDAEQQRVHTEILYFFASRGDMSVADPALKHVKHKNPKIRRTAMRILSGYLTTTPSVEPTPADQGSVPSDQQTAPADQGPVPASSASVPPDAEKNNEQDNKAQMLRDLKRTCLMVLMKMVKDTDHDVRTDALRYIASAAECADRRAIIFIASMLADSDKELQSSACGILRKVRNFPEDVMPSLALALQDGNRYIRLTALEVTPPAFMATETWCRCSSIAARRWAL